MLADIRFAIVPASIARSPNRARSFRRFGTSAPMPPICIPIDPTFANPHSANVAIENVRGASVALQRPQLRERHELIDDRPRPQQVADRPRLMPRNADQPRHRRAHHAQNRVQRVRKRNVSMSPQRSSRSPA